MFFIFYKSISLVWQIFKHILQIRNDLGVHLCDGRNQHSHHNFYPTHFFPGHSVGIGAEDVVHGARRDVLLDGIGRIDGRSGESACIGENLLQKNVLVIYDLLKILNHHKKFKSKKYPRILILIKGSSDSSITK